MRSKKIGQITEIKEKRIRTIIHIKYVDFHTINKIFDSADFEQKKFAQKLAKRLKNRPKFFCSKSAESKILLSHVDMGIKLYLIYFLVYVLKKLILCCKFTLEKEVL